MSNDKKQTAVQMAFEKLAQQGLLVVDDYENLNAYHESKAMEKEQIIDSYYYDPNCDEIKDDGEQYYNEKYKQP